MHTHLPCSHVAFLSAAQVSPVKFLFNGMLCVYKYWCANLGYLTAPCTELYTVWAPTTPNEKCIKSATSHLNWTSTHELHVWKRSLSALLTSLDWKVYVPCTVLCKLLCMKIPTFWMFLYFTPIMIAHLKSLRRRDFPFWCLVKQYEDILTVSALHRHLCVCVHSAVATWHSHIILVAEEFSTTRRPLWAFSPEDKGLRQPWCCWLWDFLCRPARASFSANPVRR